MSESTGKNLSEALESLFDEVYSGPGEKGGLMLNYGTGLAATLNGISAEKASSDVNGSSIAAHTRHLLYYLEVMDGFLKGVARMADWQEAWKQTEIAEPEWDELRSNLERKYRSVRGAFSEATSWEKDRISMSAALLVHTAYHLGAIRQMIKQPEYSDE